MTDYIITVYNILGGFGELDIKLTEINSKRLMYDIELSICICFGPAILFAEIER